MVENNEKESQFEVRIDGAVAVAAYELEPGLITFTHTNVPPELSGRGIANELAKTGLDYARDQGLRVVAACSFMEKYIDRHPEYQELLDEDDE